MVLLVSWLTERMHFEARWIDAAQETLVYWCPHCNITTPHYTCDIGIVSASAVRTPIDTVHTQYLT